MGPPLNPALITDPVYPYIDIRINQFQPRYLLSRARLTPLICNIAGFLVDMVLELLHYRLFCTHEGGPGKTMEKLKKMIPEAEIIGEFDTFAPLKKEKNRSEKEAKKWAQKMVRKMSFGGDR